MRLLAAEDPVYDFIGCFFCSANLSWSDNKPEVEDHQDDCPWWMARQLLGMSAWPDWVFDADG